MNMPFAPINIVSEIMENTGIFETHEVTTIVSMDTEASTLTFRKDEDNLLNHLKSLSD